MAVKAALAAGAAVPFELAADPTTVLKTITVAAVAPRTRSHA
jgi:hypothetical protein